MNKAKKFFYVIERKLISLLNYFMPNKYMGYYNQYLKKIGIKIQGGGQII